jgi:hypothetical protein
MNPHPHPDFFLDPHPHPHFFDADPQHWHKHKGLRVLVPNVKQTFCVLVLNEPLVQSHVEQLVLTSDQLIEHMVGPLSGLDWS